MIRSHKIAILTAETRRYILEADFGIRLLDSYLTDGFVGYEKMTDMELDAELRSLDDGEYDGWDDQDGLLVYEHEGDDWIKKFVGSNAA